MKNLKQYGNSILLNEYKFKSETDLEKNVINHQPFEELEFFNVKFNLNTRGYFLRKADLILISKKYKFWGIVEVELHGPQSKYKNHVSNQLKEQSALIDYNWTLYHESILNKDCRFNKNLDLTNLITYNKPFHFILTNNSNTHIYNTYFDYNSLVVRKFIDNDGNTAFSTEVDFCTAIKDNYNILYTNGDAILLPNPNLIDIKLNEEILITHNKVTRRGIFIPDTTDNNSRLYESGVIFFDKDKKMKIPAGKYQILKIGINNYEIVRYI
jgi:hypothetical protein